MKTASRISLCLLAVCLGVAASAESDPASPAGATPDWNPEAVAALAEQLHDEISTALEVASSAPPQETAMQQRTRDAAVTEMQQVRTISRSYADRLKQAETREDSEPFFRRLRASVTQMRRTAGDAVAVAEVVPHLERVDALLDELALHYDGS